jgi:hypothetical protein
VNSLKLSEQTTGEQRKRKIKNKSIVQPMSQLTIFPHCFFQLKYQVVLQGASKQLLVTSYAKGRISTSAQLNKEQMTVILSMKAPRNYLCLVLKKNM